MTKTLAATLKEIRKDRGWSQDDLATALGTTQSTISRYEDERLHTTWWDMHVRICELQATSPALSNLMQRPAAWERDERDEYIEQLERINANLVQALAALHHIKKPRT